MHAEAAEGRLTADPQGLLHAALELGVEAVVSVEGQLPGGAGRCERKRGRRHASSSLSASPAPPLFDILMGTHRKSRGTYPGRAPSGGSARATFPGVAARERP